MTIQIWGTVAPGYEPVREAFRQLYEDDREENSQVCAYVNGEKVVDLWGSATGDESYTADTLHTVFSSSKNFAAIAVATLVDKGILDYGEKVSKYWPEFGQKGKEDIKVEDVLRHEAGLPRLDHSFDLKDFFLENIKKNSVGQVLEEEPAHFPPEHLETKREYHGLTRGWILNEIYRRVDPAGRTIGEFLAEEINKPLGADVCIGANDETLKRYIRLSSRSRSYVMMHSFLPSFVSKSVETSPVDFYNMMALSKRFDRTREDGSQPPPPWKGLAMGNFEKLGNLMDTEDFRRGEVPSAGAGCSARGMAKVASMLANGGELDGVRFLSKEIVEKMHADPIRRLDAGLLGTNTNFTRGGFNIYRCVRYTTSKSYSFKHFHANFLRHCNNLQAFWS